MTYKPQQGESLAEAFELYLEHASKVYKKYCVTVQAIECMNDEEK